ncbi:VCBS repeat-containing protein, partial [Myxococcota bacterium]|nr:VCBS repeat-containing protein [Myxococcota bacterium]
GLRAAPTLGDLDADGDLDLLSGQYSGSFRYFRNTGSATVPAFQEQTGSSNPANGLSAASVHSQPVLVDLDGDRDLDLVAGSFSGTLQYFRNTGSARTPLFSASTNPFAAFDVGDSSAASFGDLDRDGDLDLLVGERYGSFHYFENTGSTTNPAFVERTGSANPMGTFSIGLEGSSLPSPALGDADGDGDLDVAVGVGSGGFRFFQNTGSVTTPAFRELPNAANPFRGETVGSSFAKAALADLDADGDLDLVGGADKGGFIAFQNRFGRLVPSQDVTVDVISNPSIATVGPDLDGDGDIELAGSPCAIATNTGSPTNPSFAPAINLPYTILTGCNALMSSVDIDADGDFDFVSAGTLLLNSGTPTNPSFGTSIRILPLLHPHPTGNLYNGFATFGDLDRDGDLDAAVIYLRTGVSPVLTAYFQNTGTPTSPAFIERFGVANPLPVVDGYTYLVDIDADGDTDVATIEPGSFTYHENVGVVGPTLIPRPFTDPKNPFVGLSGGSLTFLPILFGDLDGDGDADGLAQGASGLLTVENGIIRPSPRYFGPAAVPFTNQDVGSLSSPAAGDLDGDGDPDFVAVGSFGSGSLHYYENTGTATLPRITERSGVQNPFGHLNAGFTPILTLADLDADGDLDLVAGSYSLPPTEALHYFINTGTKTSSAFEERVDGLNPFQFVFVSRGAPAFGDLDGDGDPDLVMGGAPGTLRYFRNFGLAVSPVFAESTGAFNPFDGIVIGSGFMSRPTLGDIDRDGDLDLVSGDEPTGAFFYLENTGTSTAPAFVSRTGAMNPLNGLGVGGIASTPVLVDLDADGDLDVVSGGVDGTLKQFTLPEPSFTGMVGAGLALLGALIRRRRV